MIKMLDITLLDTYPSNTKDQRNQLARSHVPNRHPNIASGHVDLEKWVVSQSDPLGTKGPKGCEKCGWWGSPRWKSGQIHPRKLTNVPWKGTISIGNTSSNHFLFRGRVSFPGSISKLWEFFDASQNLDLKKPPRTQMTSYFGRFDPSKRKCETPQKGGQLGFFGRFISCYFISVDTRSKLSNSLWLNGANKQLLVELDISRYQGCRFGPESKPTLVSPIFNIDFRSLETPSVADCLFPKMFFGDKSATLLNSDVYHGNFSPYLVVRIINPKGWVPPWN